MSKFNACKSAVAGRSIKYWRLKCITRMTADNKKSYLGHFNKLVDEYNNSYHRSIDKKLTVADCSDVTEKLQSSLKATKFKIRDRVR